MNQSPMTLRDASAQDAASVHTLIRALADYEKLLADFTATEADFATLLAEGACAALLAEIDGAPVGIALYYPIVGTFAGRRGLWLEDLFVIPTHRGQGIAMALLRAVSQRAIAGGFSAVQWNVLDWNTPAIAFYRRIGAVAKNGWTEQLLTGEALHALAADKVCRD